MQNSSVKITPEFVIVATQFIKYVDKRRGLLINKAYDEFKKKYAYFDGKTWSNSVNDIATAIERKDWVEGSRQDKVWRGLTKESYDSISKIIKE